MSTIVQCECVSKKESKNYDVSKPIATAIELQVPYGKDSVYYQMSGGTLMTLNTVNKEAADMFVIGKLYDITIAPSK